MEQILLERGGVTPAAVVSAGRPQTVRTGASEDAVFACMLTFRRLSSTIVDVPHR